MKAENIIDSLKFTATEAEEQKDLFTPSHTLFKCVGDFGEVWHLLRSCGLVPKYSDVFDDAKIDAYKYANENNIKIVDFAYI